jgi:hypothetical protein
LSSTPSADGFACPVGGERPLTTGEQELARSVFGGAIDLAPVTIRRRKFFPFQPPEVVMTPRGHLHFHPRSPDYCDDIASASLAVQALFIHEMTHVWQAQRRGDLYLVLMRHPLCRYDYAIRAGWPLDRYGLEQQAEIVKHTFLARRGHHARGAAPLATYESILTFRRA